MDATVARSIAHTILATGVVGDHPEAEQAVRDAMKAMDVPLDNPTVRRTLLAVAKIASTAASSQPDEAATYMAGTVMRMAKVAAEQELA